MSLQATLEQRQADILSHESSLAELKTASQSTSAARDAVDAELASLKGTLALAEAEKEKTQSILEDTKKELTEIVLKVNFVLA